MSLISVDTGRTLATALYYILKHAVEFNAHRTSPDFNQKSTSMSLLQLLLAWCKAYSALGREEVDLDASHAA